MNIFVQQEGETYGPFSQGEILAHLQDGTFSMDDLACTEDNLEGRPLRDLLSEEESEQQPTEIAEQQPEISISNIYVQRDGEMVGPFTRGEVVGHLLDGTFSETDLACTDENLEGRPLKDLLVEESALQASAHEEAPAVQQTSSLLDLQIFRQRSVAPPPEEISSGKGRVMLVMAGALACFLGAGAIAFFKFKPTAPKLATTTPAPQNTIIQQAQRVSIAPEPQPTPDTAQPAESPVPKNVGPQNPVPTQDSAPPPSPSEMPTQDNTAQNTQPAPTLPSQAAPKPTPVALAAVRQIISPKPPKDPKEREKEKEKPRADLWVADTASNPKAILLICLSPNGNAEGTVKSPTWQTFARENGLALAAITFSSDQDMTRAIPGSIRAGSAAENILIDGIHSAFGDKVPLILYGREGGGTFAVEIQDYYPEIVKMWGAYTSNWPTVPQSSKINSPAVLACDIESIQRGKTDIHEYFVAGRAQNRPWTMVPLATDPKLRGQVFDLFFCDYVKACLATPDGKIPEGVLIGTDNKKPFSKLDAMTRAKDATWLPNTAMVDEWTSAMSAEELGGKATIIRKNVATFIPKQPELNMYLRLPPGVKSGKEVNGVLAYCTWDSNEATIVATLSIQENEKLAGLAAHHSGTLANLIRFADEHKLAVLTWGTATTWNAAVSNEDMAHSEQQKLDDTFDSLATAWEKGVQQFSSENGIPTKDFLLYGISRGAQWAHRLVLRKPGYFLAVDVHIPSSFDVPTPDANRALWLLTTGEQEYGYESAKRFYKECARLGYPIIFKAIPNLGHLDSPIADNLTSQFFEYALAVKDLHDAHESQLQNHFVISNTQQIPPWLQSFREPAFIGDFLNQDCYPGTQISMIEPTLRVPLPTKEIADAWNK